MIFRRLTFRYLFSRYFFALALGMAASQPSLGAQTFVKNEILLTTDEEVQKIATEALEGGSLLPIQDQLNEIVEKNPTSANAYYWLGRIAAERGNTQAELKFYKKSVKYNPYNADVRIELAKALTLAGETDEALDELDKVLSAQAVNLAARDARANAYAEQGKLNKAIQEYVSLVRLAPNHPLSQVAKTKLETLYFRISEDIALQLDKEDKKNRALKMADIWISQELYDPAHWLLSKVLSISPDDLEANYLMGLLYGRRGEIRLALKSLSYVVDEAPKNLSYRRAYADVLSRGGYLSQAEKHYLYIVELEKKDGVESDALNKVNLIRGEKLIRRGFYQSAINHYKKLLDADADNPELLTRIADIYMSLGDAEAANKYNQTKVDLDKKNREKLFYQRQGRNFYLAGKLAEAKFTYEKLIKLYPQNSQAYYWISKIYEREGRFEIAINYMKEGVKYAPSNVALKKEYARLLVRAKKMTQASRYYASLAESATSAKEKLEFKRLSKFVVGQQLLHSQKMQEALSHYQAMSLQFPKDVPVLEALANVYVKLQFYAEAEEAYFTALDIDRKRATTYLRLAGLYAATGEDEKRMENLVRAIELDPLGNTGKQALNFMLSNAQSNMELGNLNLADKEYQTILSVVPNNILAASNAAIIATKTHRGEYAKEMFARLIQNDPNNMKVRVQYGHMFVAMGDFDSAIREFEKIVILRSSSVEGKEAVANLAVIYNAKADAVINELNAYADPETVLKLKLPGNLDDKITSAVDLARTWIEEKQQITPAQKILKAVLEINSENGQAQYWLGSIYDQYRLFDLALIHIGISVSITPENLQLYTAYGRVLVRAGFLDAAQAVYTIVIQEARGTALAKEARALRGYVVGRRLMNEKRFADALAHYKAMENFQPDDTNLQIRIGNVYLNMGQLENAEKEFSIILAREPDNPSVHLKLAEIYRMIGDDSRYYQSLKMAIFLDNEGVVARSALDKLGYAKGLFKLKEKRWDEALEAFNKILETDPGNLQAMLGIATAYFGKGDYGKSETLYLKILKEDPSSIDARLKMARLYIMTKRISLAVAELERVVSVSTETREGKEALINLTNIYRQRGAAFLAKGFGDEAVIEYRKAISHDKDDWQAHFALGDIFRTVGMGRRDSQSNQLIDLAIKHFKETVRIRPDNIKAYGSLATIYESRQAFQLAMEMFVKALSLVEGDESEKIAILSNAVRMQIVRQEYDAQNMYWVIDELNEMAKVEPQSSRIYLFLSSAYIWLDDIDSAIVALKKVVELSPDNVNSKYRLGQMYEQTNELARAAAVYREIIFSSSTGGLVGAARQRLISVEERMQFLTIRMRYSNFLSKTRVPLVPVIDSFSSTLNFDMTARIRPSKGAELSFNVNPSYSAFHDSESDSLVSSYGVTGNFNNRKSYIIVNASQSETQGLLTEEVRGSDQTVSITEGFRLRMPSFLAGPGSVLRSTLQGNLTYRKFIGTDLTQYNVRTVSASGLYSHPFRSGGSLSLTYQFSDTGNLKPLGSDYANKSQSLSMQLSRPLASRMSGYASASFAYEKYKNIDSFQYAQNPIRKKRETGQLNLRIGLRYQIHRKLSYFMDASYSMTRTSIDKTAENRGYIYLNTGLPVGIKSTNLSDFSTVRATTGFQFQF